MSTLLTGPFGRAPVGPDDGGEGRGSGDSGSSYALANAVMPAARDANGGALRPKAKPPNGEGT